MFPLVFAVARMSSIVREVVIEVVHPIKFHLVSYSKYYLKIDNCHFVGTVLSAEYRSTRPKTLSD